MSGEKSDISAFGSLLYALGIDVFAGAEDSAEEVPVPDEIMDIARKRWEAKKAKDFASADKLRNEALEKGWIILDKKDGFSVSPKKA